MLLVSAIFDSPTNCLPLAYRPSPASFCRGRPLSPSEEVNEECARGTMLAQWNGAKKSALVSP
ncbi:hypothetical protein HMPREF3198_00588 [Winkia neuii]|nr:hypothetical protein HMPREF3198_00588 [Winkia neuii]